MAFFYFSLSEIGSTFQGKHTGRFGLLGTLSFNGNKIITTGGGGAILTDDQGLAKLAKHLTTTAKLKHRWEYIHDEIGYNYRMPNLNAALGCAQLKQLPDFLASKRRLFVRYQVDFQGIPQVRIISEPEGSQSNYWLQTMLLDESVMDQRENILETTNNVGLMTRPVWSLLNKLAPYADCPSAKITVAKSLRASMSHVFFSISRAAFSVPDRQGVHCPQLSSSKNFIRLSAMDFGSS